DPVQSVRILVHGDNRDLSGESKSLESLRCTRPSRGLQAENSIDLFLAIEDRRGLGLGLARITLVVDNFGDLDGLLPERLQDAAKPFVQVELGEDRNQQDAPAPVQQVCHATGAFYSSAIIVRANKQDASRLR